SELHVFFIPCPVDVPEHHSFPTRRSSDLTTTTGPTATTEPTPTTTAPTGTGTPTSSATTAPGDSGTSTSVPVVGGDTGGHRGPRSEEHTSELQSRENLVCRLLLEKKNTEQ